MRRVTTVVLVLLAAAAGSCGGTTGPDVSSRERDAAEEFAFTARRALTDTRFDGLGDRWLAGLVVELCTGLAAGGEPDSMISATVAAVEAPPGPVVDDEILAEVLTAGVAEVCPNAVLDAEGLGPAAAERFLGAVRPVVARSGLEGVLDDAALLAAGLDACAALDSGSDVAGAGGTVLRSLFAVDAPDLAGLEDAGLGPREGIVAGSVLGAAASTLCPEHAGQVAGSLSGVDA